MSDTELVIGAGVRCTDGICGRLHRIVVGAVDNRLTHLAVRPDGGVQAGRLVPADQIAAVDADILLRCGIADFALFEVAEAGAPPAGAAGEQGHASWPYAPHDLGGRFPSGVEGIEQDTGYGNRTFSRDRIPAGGVEVRRGELVYATDGEVGRIRGLAVDLADLQVTRLLLDKGHLWGRTRIAVPVEAVATIGDGVQLNLTREQVKARKGEGF